MPCDFIAPPSLPLTALLNQFRADCGSNGSIMTTCWYTAHKPEKTASPDEWGPTTSPTPIIWHDKTATLLHVDTVDDLDKNSEGLEVRMSLLSKYVLPTFIHLLSSYTSRFPRAHFSLNFQDSHVYVCRHSTLDILSEKPYFDSFREDFVPWLCKVQYQKLKRKKYGRG